MTEVRGFDRSRESTVNKYFSRQSEYWDSLYSDPDDQDGFTKYELNRRKEIAFDFITENHSVSINTVLDLGCGSGQYMEQLSQMGLDCYGADISEKMLQLAREKLPASPSVKWIHSDCRNVPVEDHFFDLILCVGVLEYLADDLPALKEVQRLIRPGGLVILTFPNLYKLRNLLNPYYYLVRLWTYLFACQSSPNSSGAPETFDYCKSTVRRYSLRGVDKLVESSGFRVVDARSCCFGPFSLWKNEMLPLSLTVRISAALERLLYRKGFGFLRYFSNRWVLLLQPVCPDGKGIDHLK